MPIPVRRGNWRPGRTSLALFTIEVVTTFQAAVRGLDYLRHDPDPSTLLSKVQDSAPLTVWAALFIAAATLVFLGWASHWGQVIAAGHLLAMACYGAVAYGLVQNTGLGSGVRTPSGFLVTAIIHAALGFSILATLRRREVSQQLDDESG